MNWTLLGLALSAMFCLGNWFTHKQLEKVTFSPESNPRTKHSSKARRTKGRWQKGETIEAEAGKAVSVVKLDNGHMVINTIPLAGKWLLTYAHAFFVNGEIIPNGTEMNLSYNDHLYTWKFHLDDTRLCRDPNGKLEYDIMFLKVGDKRLPSFKNLINSFLSDDDFPEKRFRISMRTKGGLVMTEAERDIQTYAYEGYQFELTDGFRYNAFTTSGDCGTPIHMAEGDGITKCVGIHVAGTLSKDFPAGLAVRVSKEMILEAIGSELTQKNAVFVAEQPLLERLEESSSPNLTQIRKIPPSASVHLSSSSKIRPSSVSEFLPWKSVKAPAIMSVEDDRSKGKDPVEEAIFRLAQAPKVVLNEDILERCRAEMIQNFIRDLDYSKTNGLRELSFEEALFGIPGALASVVTATHSGSPYCYFVNKIGKRELVWHEDQQGKFSPLFKKHCLWMYSKVRNGEPVWKVFLGYMKDEIRSESKIESVNTRITYSNDVTYNVVCRMLFGSMVVAFNNSFPKHSYALGINPSSFDASLIYSRLRESPNRLVAGDFSEFDLRHQRQIMDSSFAILASLGETLSDSAAVFEHVRSHETEVPLQIGCWSLSTKCNNPSGGFWTTILNCLTCELYFRYSFKVRFPALIFDEWIQLVILGDDHILSVKEGIEWNPLQIEESMKPLGQKYTSAVKDSALTVKYQSFSEVLFLGHYFRLVSGHYSGALRKETLEESLLWTRNKNLTIVQECQQMVEYASQWDKEYYLSYLDSVNSALSHVGQAPLVLPPWESLRVSVANRTAVNGGSFRFVAEADSSIGRAQNHPSLHVPGLITAKTETRVQSSDIVLSSRPPESRSLSEAPADLNLGPYSFVERAQYNWSGSSSVGLAILPGSGYISIPYGLMGLGDQSNIQNMPFQNYLYSQPDVEIMIQLNGSPTQAGCLLAYFVPLSTVDPQYTSWTSLPHVKLSPDENPTATLVLPFRYWTSFLDNQAAQDTNTFLGAFRLGVYSPLTTKAASTDCGVTIYSRFKTTNRIPRNIPPSAANTRPIYGFTRGTGDKLGKLYSSDTSWVAEGGNVSSTSVSNTYSVGDIAGSMPVENGSTSVGGTDQKLDQNLKVKGIPLDNPPLVGGGFPVMHQFSSMAKANGPETTTGLYLHPKEMFRQPMSFRDHEETTISSICARPGRIFNFSWTTGQADGTSLYAFDLNTTIFDDEPLAWSSSVDLPPCVLALNWFKFVHYDAVFTINVIRTKFHSGRLMVTTGYGVGSVVPSLKQALYNQVLDFNGDNSVCEVRVPYNARQEYIRSSENRPPAGSTRFGSIFISVLNELRNTSEVVADSVDVIVEVRFENVRVAVPNPYSATTMGDSSRVYFVAEAPVSETDVNAEVETTDVTKTVPVVPSEVCRVQIGEKFEYCVHDVHELVRRYIHYPMDMIGNLPLKQPTSYEPTVIPGSPNRTIYRISVEPVSMLNKMFQGWSGMLKFRIFAATSAHCTVGHVMTTKAANSDDVDISHVLMTNQGVGAGGPGQTIRAPSWSGWMAREVMHPIGSQSFIDVSIPFASEYNFLPVQRQDAGQVHPGRIGNGYIYVNVPYQVNIDVYWAAGDDFRYHVFCPTRGFRFQMGKLGAGGVFPSGVLNYAGLQSST